MKARRKVAAPRGARVRLGDLECGDVAIGPEGHLVVFGLSQDRMWVRQVDRETFREVSEPKFLDPDLRVELVKRGVERYAPSQGGEIDPPRG